MIACMAVLLANLQSLINASSMGALTNTINRIEAIELSNPFDRRTIPVYCIIMLKAIIGLSLFIYLGFSIDGQMSAMYLAWPAIILAGWMLRRINLPRMGGALEAFAILYGQGLLAVLTLSVGSALGGPYVDEMLSSWDRAIGFPWPAFVEFFRPYVRVLNFAYFTFIWQGWLIIFVLFAMRQEHRAWVFVTAATMAMFSLDFLFPLFPAKAAFIHYGVTEFEGQNAAFTFFKPLEYLRSGGREITPEMIAGMVSFPSYHAASAVFFCYAAWHTRLRWPYLILNTGLMIGTIVIGGHYLVDLIAGMTLALLTLGLSVMLLTLPAGQNLSWTPHRQPNS